MPLCYIDCSPFMQDLLPREGLPAGLRVHVGDPPAASLAGVIGKASVVLNGHTRMDGPLMDACPALRSIVFLGTGAASYVDLPAAAARGIAVRTVKGYGDQAIAEHAFGLMLAAARRIVPMDQGLRRGEWQTEAGLELAGATLGIVGAGGVGRTLARLAHGFGMRVRLWNRSPLPEALRAWQAPLDEVLAQADVLSLHLALTPETRGFLGRERLAALKPGCLLVNTARGELVQTDALVQALRDGRIGHAALDVFDIEPLPAGHPLLAAPNTTLTAHAAFKTQAASQRLLNSALALAAADLTALGEGRPLPA